MWSRSHSEMRRVGTSFSCSVYCHGMGCKVLLMSSSREMTEAPGRNSCMVTKGHTFDNSGVLSSKAIAKEDANRLLGRVLWKGFQTALSCSDFSLPSSLLPGRPAFQGCYIFCASNSSSALSPQVVESGEENTGGRKILAPSLSLCYICMCLS